MSVFARAAAGACVAYGTSHARTHEDLAQRVFRPRTIIDADGTVEGYASLFGEVDAARDMVMSGAFCETVPSLQRTTSRYVPKRVEGARGRACGAALRPDTRVHGSALPSLRAVSAIQSL
jgi:hypothetical protein